MISRVCFTTIYVDIMRCKIRKRPRSIESYLLPCYLPIPLQEGKLLRKSESFSTVIVYLDSSCL